jgi:hypothetical protein
MPLILTWTPIDFKPHTGFRGISAVPKCTRNRRCSLIARQVNHKGHEGHEEEGAGG